MKNLERYLEQTILKPTMTDKDLDQLVADAKQYNFKGICVPPFWVKKAKRDLGDADVQLVTVVGFPLGYNMTETKVFETELAIQNGADEIDVVWSTTSFKAGMNWPKIELAKLATTCHDHEKILKVIIETAYLSEDEIRTACDICSQAGVDFVKTSTGFAPSGAQLADIKLMREILPSNVGIKASGGIKTYEQAVEFIQAGADRIGTSSGVEILKGKK
ncbi:deoxyribose-phosphate aldolase [Litoribacter ruber]|uniref:Deoxyribose-phosphate aldolase n=1 Tax=Litoribacter ruber TaxID=702568 RepID=A0AAP2CGT9_9BACT|nr:MULTISPECIES: deoxyribose-phosphate aldolase [Litoribacter]MBS9524403.1 deoxyribose-phosphate aldolase [Litoribacter alkaliphilus]MBT0809798.1 deoxyribose-phosphate aldolase [Litoribacter ruber]